jgi:amidase
MRPILVALTWLALVAVLPSPKASARQATQTHRFVPAVFYDTYSAAHAPVLRMKSGDRLITSLVDDRGIDRDGTTVAHGPNPQTGPFFIEGAEPGDLLVVTIDTLAPSRDTGTSAATMVGRAVEPGALSGRADTSRVPWTIDTANRVVRFDPQAIGRTSWRARFDSPAFELPLAPTLGSIGVAPAGDNAISTTLSGPFGGNMLAAGIAAGARGSTLHRRRRVCDEVAASRNQ